MSRHKLFRAEQLPVFQNKMFTTCEEALACPKGDLELVQDSGSGLIFNAAFDPILLEYDSNYQNEQAHSPVFRRHLDDVRAIIAHWFQSSTLIEVGCGKGHFLEYLTQHGFSITGIDPAYEGNNPHVIAACFEPGLGVSADGIILRHVLEHIVDPVGFLQGIAEANGRKGLIYIEVPCFDWICRNRAWFDLFYEHVNYFRIGDFFRIFANVVESGHLFGGQYLYVVADLATLRRPQAVATEEVQFPEDFTSDIDTYAKQILQDDGRRQRAVWGGASKGLIFSLYMKRRGAEIETIIDINPAKQGKYVAASGLLVTSPNEAIQSLSPGSDIFVMNSNYFDEIVQQSNQLFNYIKVDQHEF